MSKSETSSKERKNPDPNRSQVIRLGKGQAAKLEKLANKFEVTQAQLVRWAVDAMERKIEAMGGKMTLPFDFDLPDDLTAGSNAEPDSQDSVKNNQ